MEGSINGRAKPERKTVEKNRRMVMKDLCNKLSSLVPKHHDSNSKEGSTTQNSLQRAASYIMQLRERIEKLKKTKEAMPSKELDSNIIDEKRLKVPVIEIRCRDSFLDLLLIFELGDDFCFHKLIKVLMEEGTQVVNANFSIAGDKIVYTIVSQICSSRIGMDSSTLRQRLQEFLLQ